MFVFQENVINECQNIDKPIGMIWLFTRKNQFVTNFSLFPHILSEELWIFALNRSGVSSPSVCINIIDTYVPISYSAMVQSFLPFASLHTF